MSCIRLELSNPCSQSKEAFKLIELTKKKNKLDFYLIIKYNFELIGDDKNELMGSYTPGTDYIEINPNLCTGDEEYSFQRSTNDNSIFGIILHEFSHYLSLRYFKKMKKDFVETFPIGRLLINNYRLANEDIDEEIAELLSLYISNPYFLKLISIDHWKFFKKYFLSPTKCDKLTFISFYNLFPMELKNKIKQDWKLEVDYNKMDIIKE